MNTPLVSVIIPVYNVAPYLRQCLDSMCNQTLKDIEIICVDDGSTDGSIEILEEYAACDSRVTILKQKNQYAGVARQNGMSIAKGKYLAFLDSDDFFEPDMLQKMVDAAEAQRSDIVVCRADAYIEDKKIYGNSPGMLRLDLLKPGTNLACFDPQDALGKHLLHFVQLAPWAKLIRTSFVRKYELQWAPLPHANDVLFVGSALALASSMSVVDEVLVHYRVRSNSISHNKKKDITIHYIAYEQLKSKLESCGVSSAVMHSFKERLLTSALWNISTLEQSRARQVRELIISKYEPQFQLLDEPEDAYFHREAYRKYKSLIRPARTLIIRESDLIGYAKVEIERLLKMLIAWQDGDFDILCVSKHEGADVYQLFESAALKHLRCEHVVCNDDSREKMCSCRGEYGIILTNVHMLRADVNEIFDSISSIPSLRSGVYYDGYVKRLKEIIDPVGARQMQTKPQSREHVKVSVIVPVYKAMPYLPLLLSCLQSQTLREMEFIFVDDKGADGTYEIVKDAAKYDSRIVCLDNVVNRGPGYSRNRGVEVARGDYVAFVDADDLVSHDFYELLYERAIKEKALIVKGNVQSIYYDGTTKLSRLNEVVESGLKQKVDLMNLFTHEHWSAIYNRKYVREKGAFYHENSKYGEDTYFLMCLMYYVSPSDFALVNKAVYYYRQNESSLMHAKKDAFYLQQIRCRAEVRFDWLDSKPDSRKILKYAAKVFEDQLGWLIDDVIDNVDESLLEDYLLFLFEKLKNRMFRGNGFTPGIYAESLLESSGRLERFRVFRTVLPKLRTLRNAVDGKQRSINVLQRRIDVLQQDVVALRRVANLGLIAPELRRRYRLLAIRKFFSFGKRRKYYKEKLSNLRNEIRECKQRME